MHYNTESTPLRIAEYIKTEIISGRLEVGSKLPSERELVKTFDVSRSSVREAIKTLTTMGYLEPITRKGTFVSKRYIDNQYANTELNKIFGLASILDLMELRLILEENFIPLVITRYTCEDIQNMNNAIIKMETGTDDINFFFEGDLDFHQAMAESTHNIVIIEIMRLIKRRIYEHKEDFKAVGIVEKNNTIKSFKKIVNLILENNTTEAQLLYYNHLYSVERYFKSES